MERPSTGFDDAYLGTPPWDLGRPQRAFVDLEAAGAINGRVLDIGCGSGALAVFLAQQGYDVVGIDASPRAIAKARTRALTEKADARFEVADALHLSVEALGGRFDTLVDSGVFHIFDDADRALYVKSLAKTARPGAIYHMLVFSEAEPTDWGGPRRIRADEIRSAFRTGWAVERIAPARFETLLPGVAGHAWLASFRRASTS